MPLPNRPAGEQRRYSEQERARAVALVRQAGAEGRGQGAVGRVARQLGYGVKSVRSWVKQADIDAGDAPGTTTADAERLKTLEAENRELRRANEILPRGGRRTNLEHRGRVWAG